MAIDDSGVGIPLPPDSTKLHEFPKIVRDGLNKVAEILAGDLTPATEAAIEAGVQAAAGPAVAAEIADAGVLTGAGQTSGEAALFSITDSAGRRSWLEIGADGQPTQNSLDLLGRKVALPQTLNSATAIFSITDSAGRRSWLEIGADGRPTQHSLSLLAAAGVGVTDGSITEAKLAADLAARVPAAFTTADAKIDETRRLTVRDRLGTVRQLTATPGRFAFWGDSLLEGHPVPPFAADQSDSVPGVFASLMPGATVLNGGKSGQSADEIAIRQGGLVPMLTVTGGTIPASGGVTVTTDAVLGWRLDRSINGTTGSLAGIPGTLTRTGSTLTFTRTAAGTATAVAGPVPWETFGRAWADAVQIILAGRNDIGYTSSAGPVVDRVVTATRAMVESLTPANPRVLLLGTITSTGEGKGTANYNDVTAINGALKKLYPQYFFDYRAWLVNEAIYELGITPTTDDLQKIAADTLPSSIMVSGDAVHYSPATAAKAAARIKTELTSKGWI